MCISCLPKPFGQSASEYVQLALRCTPVIGFVTVCMHDKEFTIFKMQLEGTDSHFLEHAQEYSKSQKIAGIISLVIAVVLIILGLPQVLGASFLICGGVIAALIGLIHFVMSSCMSHDDLSAHKEFISDLEAMHEATTNQINQEYDAMLEANEKLSQHEKRRGEEFKKLVKENGLGNIINAPN